MPHTLTTTHPADEVTRWLIRIRAYFLKEVREIRRQPLLLISLVAGDRKSVV